MSSVSSSRPSPSPSSVAGFGTNEWLVEEMYQQYLADPSTVDQAWHEFFADYRPGSPLGAPDGSGAGAAGSGGSPLSAVSSARSPASDTGLPGR